MPFLIMMIIGTFSIASAAIYFSVLGLVQTFSETALFWGTAIEVAKLILASFVYRYWDDLQTFYRALCIFFIGMLMVITSLGISGHILSSMQQSDLELSSQQIQVQAVETRLSRTQDRIDFIDQRLDQERTRFQAIEDEISEIPNTFVTARRQLIQERQPEKDEIQDRMNGMFVERETLFQQLEESEQEISQLSLQTEQIEIKVGPIVKIVETFGADAEKAIYIFILIIVLSFDPVAVMLTISSNRVALDIKHKKQQTVDGVVEPKIPVATNTNDKKLDQIVDTMGNLQAKLDEDDERKRQVRDSLS